MNLAPIVARGVRIVAEIHHSHGVKAAVCVVHLHERFPEWTDEFWHTALHRAKWFDELTVEVPAYAPALTMSPRRAQFLLARAVVPACYSAVRGWVEAEGAEAVIAHYIDRACADPGDLGHRLSVLLAVREAWPWYRDGPDRTLWLDRLAEFIVACQFPESTDADPARSGTWSEALAAALVHPGFFGHHLICLAWIGRNRESLGPARTGKALAWVVQASRTVDSDDEDNRSIVPVETATVKDEALDHALRALLTRGRANIHLLTLADSIAWLWTDSPHAARVHLLAVAGKFTEQAAT